MPSILKQDTPMQVGNFNRKEVYTSNEVPVKTATCETIFDAARIAACWNACLGITPEALSVIQREGGVAAVMSKMMDDLGVPK